jgi:CheY-like chemotaxis protein
MHTSSATIGQQGPAILVIEEHEHTRRRIANALRSSDYRSIEAANGATGLQLLEEGTPVSAIVLDLVLPRMSGWDFRRRQLRTRFAAIPIIVISGQPLHPNDLDVLRPAQVLDKPPDIELLLAAIGRLSTPVAPRPTLFWSKRGEVACGNHTPMAGSTRWTEEGWCGITRLDKHQIAYQCQHCAADRSPIARRSRRIENRCSQDDGRPGTHDSANCRRPVHTASAP